MKQAAKEEWDTWITGLLFVPQPGSMEIFWPTVTDRQGQILTLWKAAALTEVSVPFGEIPERLEEDSDSCDSGPFRNRNLYPVAWLAGSLVDDQELEGGAKEWMKF